MTTPPQPGGEPSPPLAQPGPPPAPQGPWPIPPQPRPPQPGYGPRPVPGYGPPPPGYGPPPPGYGPPPQPGYGQVPAYQPPLLPVPTSPGGQPLAEFTDRLLARLIDGAILSAAGVVIIGPIYLFAFLAFIPTSTVVNGQSYRPSGADVASFLLPLLGIILVVIVLSVVMAYIYEVEMMFRSGQTVGKRVMKIRIIPLDPAAPLTRGHAARRFLVQQGSALVPGLNWLDGLWQLWDKPYRQCLHDKFAATVVIKLKA